MNKIKLKKYKKHINNALKKIYDFFKGIGKSTALSRMSTREQTFFMKRLAFLIRAGIPMFESLTIIEEQTRKKNHAIIFKTIASDISSGQYLSTSLAKFNNMFGDFSINIVAFGESTGMLSDNLEYLAEELKKKDALKKKIIGAFVYPAIVTLATFGITGFLMIYLFPKIVPVFASLHADLPFSTKIVIFISNFLTHHWLALFLTILIFIFSIILALNKSKKFHLYFDKVLMKIPVLGNIIQSYNLANITRTLGLLLKSGVPIGESIEISAKICANLIYKEELGLLAKIVDRGERISVYLSTSRNLFPDILTQIISVGERSGNLPHSLIYLSELYEAEVDDFTKNLSSTIEPLLMIVMGIMVGFIAVSIITPIYGITQHLQPK